MSLDEFRCLQLICRRLGFFFRLAGPFIAQKGLTSALTDQGPYEFVVSGAGDDYINLANTYLFVEAQIVADDDTPLDGGADVGPIRQSRCQSFLLPIPMFDTSLCRWNFK
jgi:hypothetical protein